MTGIRKNLYYNTLLTSAYYVFPLLVYPYVSRVLGVAGIGLVGFIDSIATYFILFSMMGISILGVRETARCGASLVRRRSVFYSLLALHGILTAVALAAMIAVTLCVPELRDQWQMMGVGACKLVFNLFLVEWFYRGLEDFRFITLRSLLIRGLYVVSVFVFVRHRQDILVYYVLTLLVVAVSAAVNMWHSRRFMARRRVPLDLRRYVRPFFSLGAYELLASAYTTLNVAFLGFVSTDTEVGYYTTAVKLVSILMMVYVSFSGVLLPRMSSLAAEGDMDRFDAYLRKAMRILLWFSVPVVAVVEIFAPEVVLLLSGPGYEGAVTPIRIMIPFLLITGVEQLFTVQTLMPMGKERVIFRNTILGAVTGVALNILLVPHMGAEGSAIVWAAAELVIFVGAMVSVIRLRRLRNGV